MANKMMGGYYPKCSSKQKTFKKNDDISGTISIEDGNLKFQAKLFGFVNLKSNDFLIPLSDIDKVEAMNLNGVFPFGVCVYLKDGRECMLGSYRNKKLAEMISNSL